GPQHPRRDPVRRPGHPHPRGERAPAQGHGRHRRAADPVAHHEALQPLRVPPLHPLPGLQGLGDQAVLPRLPRPHLGLHPEAVRRRPRAPLHRRHRRRGLGDHLRRDRPGGRHRRPAAAHPRLRRHPAVPHDLRRRRVGRRHRQPRARPPRGRPRRHRHRRAPHVEVRRDAGRRRRRRGVQREAHAGHGLGQRRVLRVRPVVPRRLPRRRRGPVPRGRAAAEARPRPAAHREQARGLLGRDGHLQGLPGPQRDVAQGRRPLEAVEGRRPHLV
ncbi:MAG: Glucose-1-phosphate cytidylyltransferase, partial [uncultured Pseudonocardia sp.]